jgi:transposase
VKYSRFSPQKISQIISAFCEDIIKITNAYFHEIRRKISDHCLVEEKSAFGEFELDESYFGAHRIYGKRGRGSA